MIEADEPMDELTVHARTARKMLDSPVWVPSRALWARLTGHLDTALARATAAEQALQEAVEARENIRQLMMEFLNINPSEPVPFDNLRRGVKTLGPTGSQVFLDQVLTILAKAEAKP